MGHVLKNAWASLKFAVPRTVFAHLPAGGIPLAGAGMHPGVASPSWGRSETKPLVLLHKPSLSAQGMAEGCCFPQSCTCDCSLVENYLFIVWLWECTFSKYNINVTCIQKRKWEFISCGTCESPLRRLMGPDWNSPLH